MFALVQQELRYQTNSTAAFVLTIKAAIDSAKSFTQAAKPDVTVSSCAPMASDRPEEAFEASENVKKAQPNMFPKEFYTPYISDLSKTRRPSPSG